MLPEAGLLVNAGGQQLLCPLLPRRGHIQVSAACAVRPGLFPKIPQCFQRGGHKGVIRVQKCDALPPCLLQPQIAGAGHATVGHVKDPDAGIPRD